MVNKYYIMNGAAFNHQSSPWQGPPGSEGRGVLQVVGPQNFDDDWPMWNFPEFSALTKQNKHVETQHLKYIKHILVSVADQWLPSTFALVIRRLDYHPRLKESFVVKRDNHE